MKRELYDKAETLLSGVCDAEYTLDKLKCYNTDRACVLNIGSAQCGGTSVYIETPLAEQIVKLAREYYEKKKAEYQKQFDEL